jgi:hypothetical protein
MQHEKYSGDHAISWSISWMKTSCSNLSVVKHPVRSPYYAAWDSLDDMVATEAYARMPHHEYIVSDDAHDVLLG